MSSSSTVSPWLPYWQRKARPRVRLFCFPYAGGGASIFRLWSERLPAEIEVCPVQLPGRENRLREKPFEGILPLVETLGSALNPYFDMPFAFFGHSMGALISFELARYLSTSGIEAALIHLFMSGHRAPQLPDPDPPTYHLPEQEFVQELKRLQGTPEEVMQDPELLQILMPLLRADFAICEKYIYTYSRPLGCPITAFGGLRDEEVSRSELAAWQTQTSGMFKQRFFPGDHFFLHKEQGSLLRAIALDLFDSLR
ncbi:thioesterase II family protein [Ktedonobacter robiniae]|uniref:thioesterase II family protein n=1 Tax=Ktedonobacter robiniae TaxID=2778365 RepID=UPI001916029E|nr:thioesterase [Ktedonobacter robiniae]